MSLGLAVLLLMLGGMVIAALVGYLLAWWIIGHNPVHKGRCP